jgi:hypothetical protein
LTLYKKEAVMDSLSKLEWIVEEFLNSVNPAKNSFDEGKNSAYRKVLKEIKDLKVKERLETN